MMNSFEHRISQWRECNQAPLVLINHEQLLHTIDVYNVLVLFNETATFPNRGYYHSSTRSNAPLRLLSTSIDVDHTSR
jgi:hypothetical protein